MSEIQVPWYLAVFPKSRLGSGAARRLAIRCVDAPAARLGRGRFHQDVLDRASRTSLAHRGAKLAAVSASTSQRTDTKVDVTELLYDLVWGPSLHLPFLSTRLLSITRSPLCNPDSAAFV